MRPLIILALLTSQALADDAFYAEPVTRYQHNILGNTPEWSAICNGTKCTHLAEDQIFEDIAPRAYDLNYDGHPEYLTVISKIGQGSSLAIFDDNLQLITQTPYIGTNHRWLAPIGVADFNNDGVMDIAYVETPHIGGIVKIWSYQDGLLSQYLEFRTFTNHQIGENFITSDVRNCGAWSDILLLDADRSHIMAIGYFPDNASPYAVGVDEYNARNWQNRKRYACPVELK